MEIMNAASGVAQFTTYTSYAPCCPENENYDPTADREECDVYSACDYSGDFAAIGFKSIEYVKTHNLISFFDSSHPTGRFFYDNYAGRNITLRKGDVVLSAIIADTCGDDDCDGCCTINARPSGFLVDMEYWTVLNNFGSLDKADGQVFFSFDGNLTWTEGSPRGQGSVGWSVGIWDMIYFALIVGTPLAALAIAIWWCIFRRVCVPCRQVNQPPKSNAYGEVSGEVRAESDQEVAIDMNRIYDSSVI